MVDARLYQRAALGTWIVSTERSQPHRTALVALPVGLGHAWDMVWRLQCCSSWGPADVALQRNGYAGAWEGEAVGTTTLHILNLLQETCGSWGCSCGMAGLCNRAAQRLWLWEPGRLGCDKEGLGRQEFTTGCGVSCAGGVRGTLRKLNISECDS